MRKVRRLYASRNCGTPRKKRFYQSFIARCIKTNDLVNPAMRDALKQSILSIFYCGMHQNRRFIQSRNAERSKTDDLFNPATKDAVKQTFLCIPQLKTQ